QNPQDQASEERRPHEVPGGADWPGHVRSLDDGGRSPEWRRRAGLVRGYGLQQSVLSRDAGVLSAHRRLELPPHAAEGRLRRQRLRQTGLSTGSVQRELDALVAAGLVTRRKDGRQVYFQPDRTSPVFPELQSLFVKTSGLADVLRRTLAPLADRITAALVYGSAARGELRNESDVDLLVIGEVTFGEVVDVLGEPQRILGREINPVVYTPADFRARAAAGRHFVSSVLKTDLIFIIGGRDDLEAMGAYPYV